MKKSKKKAFTLTELLIVVIVIGVLSAAVLPKFNKVIETRKTTEAEDLMASVRTEQEKRCALDKRYLTQMSEMTDIVKNNEKITKLCDEAADSKLDFYIDVNKSFEEQKISEKSKDLISLIYYDYIAEEEEKKEILKQWNLNEKNYQNAQKEKYNYDNIFTKKKENTTCVELKEIKKETIFEKIKNLFKKLIK